MLLLLSTGCAKEKTSGILGEATLENEYVKLTFVPEAGGRCKSFICKKTGQEFTTYDENAPLTSPWGMFADLLWNTGGKYDEFACQPYSCQFEKDKRTLVMSGRGKGHDADFRIEKQIGLKDKDYTVYLKYKIINEGKNTKKVGLWIHNFIGIDRDKTFFIPASRGVDAYPYVRSEKPAKSVWEHNPVEGWIAVVSDAGTGIASIVEYRFLKSFYLWLNLPNPTMEWRYTEIELGPGESFQTAFELLPFDGLQRVDTVANGWVIGASTIKKSYEVAERVEGAINLFSARENDAKMRASWKLIPQVSGKTVIKQELNAGAGRTVSFPFAAVPEKEGMYVLTATLEEDGEKVTGDSHLKGSYVETAVLRKYIPAGNTDYAPVFNPKEKRLEEEKAQRGFVSYMYPAVQYGSVCYLRKNLYHNLFFIMQNTLSAGVKVKKLAVSLPEGTDIFMAGKNFEHSEKGDVEHKGYTVHTFDLNPPLEISENFFNSFERPVVVLMKTGAEPGEYKIYWHMETEDGKEDRNAYRLVILPEIEMPDIPEKPLLGLFAGYTQGRFPKEVVKDMADSLKKAGIGYMSSMWNPNDMAAVKSAGMQNVANFYWNYTKDKNSLCEADVVDVHGKTRPEYACPTYVVENGGKGFEVLVKPNLLRRLESKELIDGYWLESEGPQGKHGQLYITCFCPRTKKAFLKSLGKQDADIKWPDDVKANGRYYREWVAFRRSEIDRMWEMATSVIKKEKPEIFVIPYHALMGSLFEGDTYTCKAGDVVYCGGYGIKPEQLKERLMRLKKSASGKKTMVGLIPHPRMGYRNDFGYDFADLSEDIYGNVVAAAELGADYVFVWDYGNVDGRHLGAFSRAAKYLLENFQK